MRIILKVIFILLFFGCSNRDNLNRDNLNRDTLNRDTLNRDTLRNLSKLPPPPDAPPKFIILYYGKKIIFKTKSEQTRFLDSLNIKDTKREFK
jgi:hypothetical protein